MRNEAQYLKRYQRRSRFTDIAQPLSIHNALSWQGLPQYIKQPQYKTPQMEFDDLQFALEKYNELLQSRVYLQFGIADKTNWSRAFAQREQITGLDRLKQGRLYIELTGQCLKIKALKSLLLIEKEPVCIMVGDRIHPNQ